MPKAAEPIPQSAREQKAIPDRLAEIRAKVAALKAEADALRDIMVNDPTARIGAEYIAAIRTTAYRKVTSRQVREADPELFARLACDYEMTTVVLKRRSSD